MAFDVFAETKMITEEFSARRKRGEKAKPIPIINFERILKKYGSDLIEFAEEFGSYYRALR